MPLNNYAFGKSIRYFRKKRGLSQSYLSELIDKSPSYISYVESGLRCISLDTLVDIANALNVTADILLKDSLDNSSMIIHGNHEARPSTLAQYQLKEWKGGLVWYEKDYPNLLFAKDGEIFELEGLKHLVIGGAYSVDKFYRLAHGANWFPDEQPSKEIKVYVEKQIREKPFDIVLSHTCPYKYEPTEVFLPMIDQDSVDASTEHWLDRIEEQIRYIAWFCGHWHIDKRIDRMHFLFHSFESNEQFNREEGAQ